MAKINFFTVGKARLLVVTTFLAVLTGCMVDNTGGYRGHSHTTVVFVDDYDYYPGYETYYSRNRHEYVYLERNVWVRRPAPPGVSVSVFLAAPSVRLDFHDAPEQHHRTVIQSYPRTWRGPEVHHDARPEPAAIRTEQRQIKPEPPVKNKTTAKDVHPSDKQKERPDAKTNHPDNQKKNNDKDDHHDNQQEESKDDNKGPHKSKHTENDR